jgi:aryl-alcohol dehydrogenase-like predicted oxidoreductase
MGTSRRKEVFLATKTGNRTYDGALAEVEESLKRLRTDYLEWKKAALK